jgi:phage replication initiation protein
MNERVTQSIDWLAFTVPSITVEEVSAAIGGEWLKLETGFRGYPVCWLLNTGRHGTGKLGTGAPRNPKEVHVDLSAGIVSTWEEAKVHTVLHWIFTQQGHVTRMDVALDDRRPLISVEHVRQAVQAGHAVTRCQRFQVIQTTSNRDGSSHGDTLYFGSRQSQTMLRVYDKRLELAQKQRPEANEYGVRWELEFKDERAQACGKALINLPPADWREFLVGLLRAYVDFRDTTREAEPYEKYRAPLLAWWTELTEGFVKARLVVQNDGTSLDDMCHWLGNYVSASLAVAYCQRGEPWLRELIYTGSKKWKAKHFALLNEGRQGKTYVLGGRKQE